MTRKIEVHRCTKCRVGFTNNRDFNSHRCVADLENQSLADLMAQYEAQQRAKIAKS